MGCGAGKSKTKGPEEINCSTHPKKLAEALCLLPKCPSCSQQSFALCSDCVDVHNKRNPSDMFYLQTLSNLIIEKINYYRFQVEEDQKSILSSLKAIEILINQKTNSQIKVSQFLLEIYNPLQELMKFSIKLRENERENDHDMQNSLGLYVGTIKGDGVVLDESHNVKHVFNELDTTIRDSRRIIIGYFLDTGMLLNKSYINMGYLEMTEKGANVFDHRRMILGTISKEGQILDNMQKNLGSCKAQKLKVAYEYFFSS